MADEQVTPEQPPATNTDIAAVMKAFDKAEKALQDAVKLSGDLVHEEASGLRGLFATTLATLRAGKPEGGVSSP